MSESCLLDQFVTQVMDTLPGLANEPGDLSVSLKFDLTIVIAPRPFLDAGAELSRARIRRKIQEQIREAFDLQGPRPQVNGRMLVRARRRPPGTGT